MICTRVQSSLLKIGAELEKLWVPTIMPMGLAPDPVVPVSARSQTTGAPRAEPDFSRRQALRTSSFWLLLLFIVMIYPVQAGVSLHQASHLVRRGLEATTAA